MSNYKDRKHVRKNQQALQCERCEHWQHRSCNTGITIADYRSAVRGDREIAFICQPCSATAREEPADESLQCCAENSHQSDESCNETGYVVSSSVNTTFSSENYDVSMSEYANESAADCSRSILADNSYYERDDVLESSGEGPVMLGSVIEDTPVTYEILSGASQRGKDILTDSQGYTYNLKGRKKTSSTWRCSVRNVNNVCPALVRQVGSDFFPGGKDHNHGSVPSAKARMLITQEATQQASQQVFTSAGSIVDKVANVVIQPSDVEKPNTEYIARVVNRKRQQLRPEEPSDLNFEVKEDFLPPNFYRCDVRVGDSRHLLFASDDQLAILKKAKRWYLDGTFKVVREPFTSLFSIHAFVRSGDCAKQLPLVYVLMSSRRTRDYVAVLKKLGRLLQREVNVVDFVVDFEAALWNALRHVFEDAEIHGCSFHWGQAVWRKVQEKGLSAEYVSHRGAHRFIRKLLCLPFLPAEHIGPVFESMADLAPDRFDGLLAYIRRTWIDNDMWPVHSWSVFGLSIRTNNDVEGWHRRLNGRAGGTPPFYLLIKLLYDEAQVAVRNSELISEGRLRRYQRKKYTYLQGQTHQLWDKYRNGELSSTGLLREFGNLYKPQE
ncbi:uncharacterized protein LOC132715331 isoform X2 [Ruditapes philippinarum]|uniref:uncharacterized protein LOC132715331 isoform X2 n=1 Tax=Ruditapes philippinarum TaxID=129788 RepID=UPI00295B944A|nr:uncharacterized protein LOC132715331 isoform X2 [Ruditapes philippinarum]